MGLIKKKKKRVINSNNISVTWLLFLLCSAISGDPMDCSLSGSPVHGIFQARILKWVVISYSRESSPPKRPGKMWNPHFLIIRWILYHLHHLGRKVMKLAQCAACLVTQSCPALWNPWTIAPKARLLMGILQASILKWVAMPSSRGSSQPTDQTQVSCIAGALLSET